MIGKPSVALIVNCKKSLVEKWAMLQRNVRH